MKATNLFKPVSLLLMIAALSTGVTAVNAADPVVPATTKAASPPPPKPAVPSKETREKLAVAHEKTAACLRTDRPVAECRAEMMKACQESGEHSCGMMGDRPMKQMHGGDAHDHGHMHDHMHSSSSSAASAPHAH